MATTDVGDTTKKTVTNAKTYVEQQVEQQIHALAERVGGTEATLQTVADALRKDANISFLAPAVHGGASYLGRFTGYLHGRSVDRMFGDFSGFSREQPAVATVIAVVTGFVVARGLKASLDGSSSAYAANGK